MENLDNKTSLSHKTKEFVKRRLDNFSGIAFGTGVALVLDYVAGGGINHPTGGLSMGSGFYGGISYDSKKKKTDYSKLAASCVGLAVSLTSNLEHLISTGDVRTFVNGLCVKTAVYGLGIFGGLITRSFFSDDSPTS
ncbi:MAG: hypothetical protein Q8L27_04635 [archaeon]|nr:hypothetical protein [archaeon]